MFGCCDSAVSKVGSAADCLPLIVVQGAVYVTKNAAYSWQAAVQESVDATLNRTVSSGIYFRCRKQHGCQSFFSSVSIPEFARDCMLVV